MIALASCNLLKTGDPAGNSGLTLVFKASGQFRWRNAC